MKKNELKIPTFEYLSFGNIYSGSSGDFNFKIIPDLNKETLEIKVWTGMLCLEKSEVLKEKTVPLKEKDWQEAICWLKEQNF